MLTAVLKLDKDEVAYHYILLSDQCSSRLKGYE